MVPGICSRVFSYLLFYCFSSFAEMNRSCICFPLKRSHKNIVKTQWGKCREGHTNSLNLSPRCWSTSERKIWRQQNSLSKVTMNSTETQWQTGMFPLNKGHILCVLMFFGWYINSYIQHLPLSRTTEGGETLMKRSSR